MKKTKEQFIEETERKIHKSIKFIFSNNEGNMHNYSADGEMAMISQINKYKDSLEDDTEFMKLFEDYGIDFEELFERIKNQTLNVMEAN